MSKDYIYTCVDCGAVIKNFSIVFVIHKQKPYCYECYKKIGKVGSNQ